jgi:cytochrome d ubiquinol oxidase subunit I
MAGLGTAFIALTSLAGFLLWRRKLFTQRWLLWVFVAAVIGPYIANQTGWIAAEVGRQPWVVYGLLRTKDAVSTVVPTEQVLGSLVLFSLAYLALFALWLYVINEKIRHGPPEPAEDPRDQVGLLAAAIGAHRDNASLTATRAEGQED